MTISASIPLKLRKESRRWIARNFAIFLFTVLFGVPLRAQDVPVDVRTQMTIFQTILSFERTHRTDSDGAVLTAVLFQSKFRKSAVVRDEIVAFVNKGKSGKNNSLVIIEIDLDTTDPEEIVGKKNIAVMLVCPLRSYSIPAVTRLSRKYGILSLSLVPEYVRKGISVGIDVKDAKPLILLNRSSSTTERADFDSRLFNFVKIIESSGE